ncbi:cellulose biosynthesis cyclic di-GMP-binding regulatory protein BcsB [Frigidibacter sp.]|uniref:cellulose biosynthesis cyclic di-GMP-binding regulatory protein BcsB n=1 Tax=Frigidibacter sp. TaxID=2586418 RepID=UPI00273477E3|nr:cellulose biosynthesis cyclic di-GMP-binding regulatory protein BcsB [Frigidibacter sp.]MDP3341995.1 cellulose biosynthesis cyclic di-GMP-binding regulatory protein BcsB [Frigidibacter sp.]
MTAQLAPWATLHAALALALWAAAAAAQDSPLIEAFPAEDTAPAEAAIAEQVLRDSGSDAAAAPVQTWLLPLRPSVPVLPSNGSAADNAALPGAFRLTGEQSGAEFMLWLPDGASASDLVLAYRSSINVLPERSQLSVSVNGEPAGAFLLTSFAQFTPVTLQSTALRPGLNRVQIDVVHHHRIFCGPEASFAVWTELLLPQSGVTMQAARLGADAAGFLAAASAQVASGAPIEIRADGALDPLLLRNLSARLTAALAATPDFRVVSPWTPQTGAPSKARITVLQGGTGRASIEQGGDGAVVLLLDPAAGVELPLESVLPPLAAAETPQAGAVPALQPGQATPFADLGLGDTTARGHYILHDMNFRLPDDWLILASQEARFTLLYGFADALPSGSLMLVKVNGQTVRLLPLDRNGGRVQPPLEMGFAANLLRPGANRVSFEAILPGDPPDMPCAPLKEETLTILGSSTLWTPPAPAMDLPNMARPLARLTTDGVQGTSAASAATEELLLPFAALYQPPEPRADRAPAVLTVARIDAPGEMPLAALGLTRRMLEEAVAQMPASTEDSAGGPQDSWLHRRWADLVGLALPGDPPLDRWLADRHGIAMLLQPDPEVPQHLWLLLGPGTDPAFVAAALEAGRRAFDGPRGQVSLLGPDGRWTSWADPDRPPRLQEPLRPGNLRFVLGNYASWSPMLFTGVLVLLALISSLVAMSFVVGNRGARK